MIRERAGEEERLIEQQDRAREERERQKRTGKDLEKAREYFDRSDFSRLVKELASVAENTPSLVRGVVAPNAVGSITFISLYGERKDGIYELSPEGYRKYLDMSNRLSEVGISLIWKAGKTSSHKERNGYGHEWNAWHERYKLITIGCDQLGTIVIRKSWGDIKLPLTKWLGNPTVQEEALGKAYNSPRLISIHKDDRGPSSDPIQNR